MNRLRWAPWKESAVSTSHEHIEGLSSIVPTSCHREGGIVQNSSGRIIFSNPPYLGLVAEPVVIGVSVATSPGIGAGRFDALRELVGAWPWLAGRRGVRDAIPGGRVHCSSSPRLTAGVSVAPAASPAVSALVIGQVAG